MNSARSPRSRRTDTDYSTYTEYRCHHCNERCINRRESLAGERHVCKSCVRVPEVPSLDDPKPPTGGNRFA